MGKEVLGQKEKIQILISEYNSLRGEINSRVSNVFQVLALVAGAVALCIQSKWDGQNLLTALLVTGLVTAALLWLIYHNLFNAVLRVQELELEINQRMKEKLLIWENERGGLAISRWQMEFILVFLNLWRPKPRKNSRFMQENH